LLQLYKWKTDKSEIENHCFHKTAEAIYNLFFVIAININIPRMRCYKERFHSRKKNTMLKEKLILLIGWENVKLDFNIYI